MKEAARRVPNTLSTESKNWKEENICVPKEEGIQWGKGGRSERQREKWCDEKKRNEGKWKKKKRKGTRK